MPKEKLREAEKAFLAALEARKDTLLEEVREADHEGERRYGRIKSLQAESDDLENRIASLETERGSLPAAAYRAGMDEDFQREDELKVRYKAAGEELAAARQRLPEVTADLEALMPRRRGHHLDAEINAYRESVTTASAAKTELAELKQRVVKALEGALDPVARAHGLAVGDMTSWNTQRSWDLAETKKYGRTTAEQAATIQEQQERERLRSKQKTA